MSRSRRGFTLIEIITTIAIIVILTAIAFPVARILLEQGKRKNTAGVVMSVANAITGHDVKVVNVSLDPAAAPQARRIFDIDDDGILDGDPSLLGGSLQSLAPPGYEGFLGETGAPIPNSFVDDRRQVTDAWGQALRIAHVSGGYANADHGVWSIGPDGVDQQGAEESDDITSWH
jgi:prepilin-type N-terminal cleavage/methylation domain-containing protein